MNRLLLAVLLVAALGVGWLAGLEPAVGPGPVRATGDQTLRVNPGGTGHGVYMTCGWHSICEDPYPDGNGIDWGNYAYEDVYWRSWGYVQSSLAVQIAKVTVGNRNQYYNCKTSVADVNDYTYGTSLGRVLYQHVDFLAQEGDYFYAYGKTTWKDTSWGPIAEAADEEQCTAWSNPHLHQDTGGVGTGLSWTRNGSTYTWYAPDHASGALDISYLNYWQFAIDW